MLWDTGRPGFGMWDTERPGSGMWDTGSLGSWWRVVVAVEVGVAELTGLMSDAEGGKPPVACDAGASMLWDTGRPGSGMWRVVVAPEVGIPVACDVGAALAAPATPSVEKPMIPAVTTAAAQRPMRLREEVVFMMNSPVRVVFCC